MSVSPGPTRLRARRLAAAMVGLLAVALAVAGCTATADEDNPVPRSGGTPSAPTSSAAPVVSAVHVRSNLPKDASQTVPVDTVVRLRTEDGTFEKVDVTFGRDKSLDGHFDAGRTTWTSTQRLEPGRRYRVRTVAVDDKGLTKTRNGSFRTDPLTLEEQTYPSIAPLQGETVGVGMPVIVHFDVPVTDKAAIEKHLSVESSPKQVGAWHWISDNEVHWRPRHYWKPGTDVTVHADVNSIDAGNGVYGQLSRTSSFHVGDSMVSKVDVKAHRMRVFRNGTLVRTMPISAGKPGFITRSGVKVIIEKMQHKVMDAATVGIPKSSPEYYKLDVYWAMRVTYSGEFVHAAPWSTGSQGIANVSHGCVGMSTKNAKWLYKLTKRGDVVEVTGSNRHMTLTNGYGDWNESFAEYKQGSALS